MILIIDTPVPELKNQNNKKCLILRLIELVILVVFVSFNTLTQENAKQDKTTQEVKTTSTTHSPGNINNKKDNISVMKTTLAEKTTLEKPVCVHRRGAGAQRMEGGPKSLAKHQNT